MVRRPAPAEAPSPAADRRRRRFDERDRRIRDTAQRLLVERGLHGFSMDDVAEAIEFSKGTVYQHYASKEDALVAGCVDACSELSAALERAIATATSSRGRMEAIFDAYCRFVREREIRFRTIPLIQAPTVLERVSPSRLAEMETARGRCVVLCERTVADAVAAGDLRLPGGSSAGTVAFALWALLFGGFLLAELHRPEGILGVRDPTDALRAGWQAHLDGLSWRRRPRTAPTPARPKAKFTTRNGGARDPRT